MNDSNKLRGSGVEDRSYEALQRFAQAAHVKHVQPIPETWVKAVNRGDAKSEELIETRRMIDDYIRMGSAAALPPCDHQFIHRNGLPCDHILAHQLWFVLTGGTTTAFTCTCKTPT